MNFKNFLIESYMSDVRKTLGKLPKKHSALLKGYKFKFEDGNELKGDSEHIGFIDEDKKTVTISAPWRYAREFTLLHELAHSIWKYLMNDKLRKEWTKISKKNPDQNQNNIEENFCMAYAAVYCKHPPTTHTHTTWTTFIKNKTPK